MHSNTVCVSCAIPTADEFNHYTTSTPHRHNNGIYCTSIVLHGINTPKSNSADILRKQDMSAIYSQK